MARKMAMTPTLAEVTIYMTIVTLTFSAILLVLALVLALYYGSCLVASDLVQI